MPGSAREVSNAIEEGIDFLWLSNPNRFIGKDNVEAVEVTKMELGEADPQVEENLFQLKILNIKLMLTL